MRREYEILVEDRYSNAPRAEELAKILGGKLAEVSICSVTGEMHLRQIVRLPGFIGTAAELEYELASIIKKTSRANGISIRAMPCRVNKSVIEVMTLDFLDKYNETWRIWDSYLNGINRIHRLTGPAEHTWAKNREESWSSWLVNGESCDSFDHLINQKPSTESVMEYLAVKSVHFKVIRELYVGGAIELDETVAENLEIGF